MDSTLAILIAIAAATAVIAGVVWMAFNRLGAAQQGGDQVDRLAQQQSELAGQLSAMQNTQLQVSRAVEERLEAVSKRLGDGLNEHHQRTTDVIKQVHERLAVIDAAQENLTSLTDQVTSLQSLFSNKQARGAFGEVQLADIVRDFLPSSVYAFQVQIGDQKRADCLLRLPNPPGPIVIDAKFPLESYRQLQSATDDAQQQNAARQFAQDVKKHIKDIADKYIVPGETTDGALMFLPSEAIYAELHTNFMNVVEESHRRRVYIVSPSTLMAFLNSMRALLKDVHMREQAGLIQAEVKKLVRNVELLDERIAKVRRNFDIANKAIGEVQTSSERIKSDIARVEKIELNDETPSEELTPPQAEPRLAVTNND